MPEHLREIRYATRRLRATPAFAVASTLVLALTLGVGTALFSVINSLLLRPQPFEQRAGLVRAAWTTDGHDLAGYTGFPSDIARRLLFERDFATMALAGFASDDAALSIAGNARVLNAEFIAGAYFRNLDATAVAGRLLRPDDSDPAAQPVAVVSERLWQASRNAGHDLLYESIVVAGKHVVIVGVVAAPFQGMYGGRPTDVWMPGWERQFWNILGSLRGHSNAEQADAEAKSRLAGADNEHRIDIREGLRGPLPVAAYIVGVASLALCAVVVIVAGASVTNLFLARTSARRGEIAVRLMLGAGSRDIRRLVSLEVALITVSAGALSIAAAIGTVRLVLDVVVRSDRIWVLNLQPDWRTLSYVALATLATLTAIGRVIAHHASRIEGLGPLSATGGLGGSTRADDLIRRRLLAVQVAGSTLLLILAAMLIRGASTGLSFAAGFDPTGAAIGWIDHRSHGHNVNTARAVERHIVETAQQMDRTAGVAVATTLPVSDRSGKLVDALADNGSRRLFASTNGVSQGFFNAFGLKLLRGRDFLEREILAAEPVAVLSEAAALALWPKTDSVGRRFRVTDPSQQKPDSVTYTVIGVVTNTETPSRRPGSNRFVFVPVGFVPIGLRNSRVAVIVRARSQPESVRLLQKAVAEAGHDLALENSGALEDAVAVSRTERRSSGLLLVAIGLLAMTIALVGVYGLVSHSISERRREFGVLIALGASGSALLVRLMTEFARPLMRGAMFGVAASVPGAFLLRRYIWDLQPLDWLAVSIVPAALVSVGFGAAMLPLRTIIGRSVADLLKTS